MDGARSCRYVASFRFRVVPEGQRLMKKAMAVSVAELAALPAPPDETTLGPDGQPLLAAQAFAFPESSRDEDGSQALSMRLGYMPARALRAQRLHHFLLGRVVPCRVENKEGAGEAEAEGVGGSGDGAGGGDSGDEVDLRSLAASLPPSLYFALCGLWAQPPDPRLLLHLSRPAEARGGEAATMSQLPVDSASFFLCPVGQLPGRPGEARASASRTDAERRRERQQQKAASRLKELMHLLESLKLLKRIDDAAAAPTQESPSAAGPAAAGGGGAAAAPRYRVVTAASHVQWHGAPSSKDSDEDGMNSTWREYSLEQAEERAEYWEALRLICSDRLPKRGHARVHPSGRFDVTRRGLAEDGGHPLRRCTSTLCTRRTREHALLYPPAKGAPA